MVYFTFGVMSSTFLIFPIISDPFLLIAEEISKDKRNRPVSNDPVGKWLKKRIHTSAGEALGVKDNLFLIQYLYSLAITTYNRKKSIKF